MNSEIRSLLHTDFLTFARLVFRTLYPNDELSEDLYLEYLCYEIDQFARSRNPRIIINMPPRHAKTFLAAICGAAWILAHQPWAKILIVTNNERLCSEIAYPIRKILRQRWFREVFSTRIADDRAARLRFLTTKGGGVYAAPVGGALTGMGADVIIVDDFLRIEDAVDPEWINESNEYFDTVIESRLNNPKQGRVMVIQHRIHEDDLTGHLDGEDWHRVVLPMIAPKDAEYQWGNRHWFRKAGDLLRPDVFTEDRIARLRRLTRNPNFETLYQQNPTDGIGRIDEECFTLGSGRTPQGLPLILSVDPGQLGGHNHSFSVAQVWCRDGRLYRLVDQWRQQCTLRELVDACQRLIRNYRPSVVIIEMTAQGPSLASYLKLENWVRLVRVTPDRPKVERLAEHYNTISSRQIELPINAEWAGEYIAEFKAFPRGRYTDQIDATTQYLAFAKTDPVLKRPPRRVVAMLALRPGPSWTTTYDPEIARNYRDNRVGCVALRSRFQRW